MKHARMLILAFALLLSCKKPPREHLLVAGSNSMHVFMTPVVEAFRKKYPNVDVVSEAGGATAGIIAVKRHAIDVATITRDLKPHEDDNRIRNFLVARDGIALVVSPKNPVGNITMSQAKDIYAGRIKSWKDVGGADAPIRLVIRDGKSSTQMSIRDLLLGGDEMPDGTVAASEDGLVAALLGDPNALGFLSLRRLRTEVKALTVDGVAMSRLTLLSGRYPLSRSFYLAIYDIPSVPVAELFVEFTLSKEGQDAFAAEGLIPVY